MLISSAADERITYKSFIRLTDDDLKQLGFRMGERKLLADWICLQQIEVVEQRTLNTTPSNVGPSGANFPTREDGAATISRQTPTHSDVNGSATIPSRQTPTQSDVNGDADSPFTPVSVTTPMSINRQRRSLSVKFKV
jgi:hypothetical protein